MGLWPSAPAENTEDWDAYASGTQQVRDRAYQAEEVLEPLGPASADGGVRLEEKKTFKLDLPFVLEEGVEAAPDDGLLRLHFRVQFRAEQRCRAVVSFLAGVRSAADGAFEGIEGELPDQAFDLDGQSPAFDLAVDPDELRKKARGLKQSPSHVVVSLCSATTDLRIIHHFRFEAAPANHFGLTSRSVVVGRELIALKAAFGLCNTPLFSASGESACIVCMAEQPTSMLEPCRHVCVCDGCALQLRASTTQCPVCRRVFSAIVKLT